MNKPAYVEVWLPSGAALVLLDADRVTVGRDESNDVVVDSDEEVSRLHAAFERYSAG